MAISYTTWNPADKGEGLTLSGGDLTVAVVTDGPNYRGVRAIKPLSSGKYYWEITAADYAGGGSYAIGIADSGHSLTVQLGDGASGYGYIDQKGSTGGKRNNSVLAEYGNRYYAADVIGVALDLDNGKIWWSLNGVWQASGDPEAGTNEAYSGLSGALYPAVSLFRYSQACSIIANFGASAFSYSVPSGFIAGIPDTWTVIDLSLEVVGYGNFGAHGDDITLPAPRITFMAGYGHDGIPWPMLTITSETIPGIVGTAEVDLPGLSASSRSGAPIRLDLPALTFEAIGGIGTEVRLDLPALEVEAVGGGQSRFELPMLTVEAAGKAGEAGSASLALPMLSTDAIGTVLIFGIADLDLSALRFVGTGYAGELCELKSDLPILTMLASGALQPSGSVEDEDLALVVFGTGSSPFRYWNYILEHER